MEASRVRRNAADTVRALTAGALFIVLAVAVATGNTKQLDEALQRRQRRPRRGMRYDIARATKALAMPKLQLVLAAALTYRLCRARVRGATAILGVVAGGMLADKVCKRLVRRQRPPGYYGKQGDESFPSGHAAATAALALTVARFLERDEIVRAPRATLGALLLTVFVAETRLVLDEHWPSDVLAGALLGSGASYGALAVTMPRVSTTAYHSVGTLRPREGGESIGTVILEQWAARDVGSTS